MNGFNLPPGVRLQDISPKEEVELCVLCSNPAERLDSWGWCERCQERWIERHLGPLREPPMQPN